MRSIRIVPFIVLLWLLAISSCKRHEEVQPQNEVLLTSQLRETVLPTDVAIKLRGTPLFSLPTTAVSVYEITYKTTLFGQSVTASGLVSLPNTAGSYPVVSFQHGTIAAHSEAPTAVATTSEEYLLYSALGTVGFIAVVPDFIGFGSSSDVLHPYYLEEPTAAAVMDIVKAAKELARSKNVGCNGKLFLAGYSQGGYATMATHKAIEAQGLDGFDLVASFPAAGGYDVKRMQEYFFALTTYDEPFYIAYVAMSYKTYLDQWSAPLSNFFKDPYASALPGLFDGTRTGGQIDDALTDSVANLIQDDLRLNIDTSPTYDYIVNAFNDNSLTDWKPTRPMFMYHGDKDTTVPYQNSVETYDKLIANGASTDVVTFITLPDADHGSGVLPYIEDFIPRMVAMK